MPDKLQAEHSFTFNEKANGGEQLILHTKIYDNGNPFQLYINQELVLNSYGNSAVFNLMGSPFTPDVLRKLADELQIAINKAN